LRNQSERTLAVISLADNLHTRFALNNLAQALPEQWMIVGEDYSGFSLHRDSTSASEQDALTSLF
jgi:hypothetical protein